MAGLLLSHTGSWVDASHFEGTITLDPTTAIHPAIVGVELAYGDPTGMSISVSGMAFYPASASGPLVAGTRYFATGDGSNTVTYVVVAPAATTLVMSAHTSSAFIASHTSGVFGPLDPTNSATVTDPGWQTDDRHFLAIAAVCRTVDVGLNPTVPAGWTQLSKVSVTAFGGSFWSRVHCVYSATWAGETSATWTVPGGTAEGSAVTSRGRWHRVTPSGSRPLSMSSTRETCPRAAVGRSAYRSVQ